MSETADRRSARPRTIGWKGSAAWAEYILSGVVVLICDLVVFMRRPGSGFMPFFRNWPGLYREGLVDGAEWRERRFEGS